MSDPTRAPLRRPTFRPQVESLEDRSVPATAFQMADTIVITGDNSSESITINDTGTNKDNAITITGITNLFTFTQAALPGANAAARRSVLVKFSVNMNGGSDTILYRFTNNVNYNAATGTILTNADLNFSGGRFFDGNMGTGRDTFNLVGQQTNGNALIAVDTFLEWVVRGQADDDKLALSFNALVQNAQMLFVAAGQRGDNGVLVDVAIDRLRFADLSDGVNNLLLPAASNSFLWTEVYGGGGGSSVLGLVVKLPNDIQTLRQLISGRSTDFAAASFGTTVMGVPGNRTLFI